MLLYDSRVHVKLSATANRRIPILEAPSAFHPHAQGNAFRRGERSTIQIVRPSESTAETQPQLHPPSLKKDDRRTVHFAIKKPQRPTSCARDTAQGKICLKNANER
jgi:hypothetical protein